jgi:hypothetical protein
LGCADSADLHQPGSRDRIDATGRQPAHIAGQCRFAGYKFKNLKIFYKQALPKVGWDKYKLINIKYINQVVGVKNETLIDSIQTPIKFMADSKTRGNKTGYGSK